MRKNRNTWIPFPLRWFSESEFLTLNGTDHKLLLLFWVRTPDGTVPKCEKRAQALAGLPVKPSRVRAALENLESLGYLLDAETHYAIRDFGKIFRKNSAKSAQFASKTADQKPKKSATSKSYSRARILSLSEREKEKSEHTDPFVGRVGVSPEEAEKLREELEEVLG
jgi:predicted metal-binding transcription factor (methanogenesis marker protein 9)